MLNVTHSRVSILFTPTSEPSLLPLLCNGRATFNATARNLNMPLGTGDGNSTQILLLLTCNTLVCASGQQTAVSASGQPVCISCAAGTYNLMLNSTCKSCPVGAVCSGGSHLAVTAGYWYHDQQMYTCPAERCCPSVCLITL